MKKKQLTKAEQIHQFDLLEYNKVIDDVRVFERKIVERNDYIIHKIIQELGLKCLMWYFLDQPKDVGVELEFAWVSNKVLSSGPDVDDIVLYSSDFAGIRCPGACFYIGNDLFDWSNDFDSDLPSFPKRWLFEPFEQKLKEGRDKYLKQLEKEKLDRKEKQKNDNKLKREALKKLTSEEKKLLGIMENK